MSKTQPDAPPADLDAAFALVQDGRFDEARRLCETFLAKGVHAVHAAFLLGAIALRQGDAAAAVRHLENAAAADPGNADILAVLGQAHQQTGDDVRAAEVLRQAADRHPERPALASNLAVSLRRLRRHDEAVAYAAGAVAAEPSNPLYRNTHGAALVAAGRLAEAAGEFQCALDADPSYGLARFNLAKCLKDLSRPADAEPHLRTLFDQRGDGTYMAAQAIWRLPLVAASADALAGAWADYEAAVRALDGADAPIDIARLLDTRTNFVAAYAGRPNRANQEALAAYYRRNCPALTWRADHVGRAAGGAAKGRLRVGFVSMNFRHHTVGELTRGLIARLDRTRFEVAVFAGGPAIDPIGRTIAADADRFAVLPPDIPRARETIAAAEPDILFYADIGMDPLTYFLAFARLATVQCVSWGHPETTGIDTIDDFISSVDLEPDDAADADGQYAERLVRLGTAPAYLYPPAGPAAAANDPGLDGLDLDDLGTVYLCPQSLVKVHPDFDAILARILERDPAGTVLFVDRNNAAAPLAERWARTIPDAAPRIRFIPLLPQAQFFALLQRVPVILDTPHFSGGLTSAQAFGLGKATVTLPGAFMRGRVTAAYYRQMGLADCIAADGEDYARIAVEMANDAAKRAAVEAAIVDARAAVFERADAVTELEDYFEAAFAEAVSEGR